MVTIQIIRNIGVHPGPGFEGFQLTLWLTHIRVEVVEVTQFLGLVSGIRVSRIVSFVMFNIDEDPVLLGRGKESLVVLESLDRWLSDEHVDFAFDGVESDRIVGGIWGEDGDGGTGGEGIDGGFVGIGVGGIVRRVRLKGGVEVIVDICDVFGQMFACVNVN